jgi:hypothetical protein
VDADAIFVGNGGPLEIVAQSGDPAPTGTFVGFGSPLIDGATTVFVGAYRSFRDYGIFRYSEGVLTTVVKTGDPAPAGAFSNLGGIALGGGQIGFVGKYDSGTREGVFLVGNDDPVPLALVGDPAPNGTFTDFDYYLSMHEQTVAFKATFGLASETGIFTTDGGSLTTIVHTNDPAPLGVFNELGIPLTNGQTTAFLASYNGFNDQGIFTGSGGPLDKVITTGDSLFGSQMLNFAPTDSNSVGIDDKGNIAFYYRLIDGREGVAIARPVPEPAICLMLIVAAVALLRIRIFPRVKSSMLHD